MLTQIWDRSGWLYLLAAYIYLMVDEKPYAFAILGWMVAAITLYSVINKEPQSLR